MKPKLTYKKINFQKAFLFLLTLFFSFFGYANKGCGKIKTLEFINGTKPISIENGHIYELSDFTDNFSIRAKVKGNSRSLIFLIENLETGEVWDYKDNKRPYQFPEEGKEWPLIPGTFKVKGRLFSKKDVLCDEFNLTFSIKDTAEACGKIKKLVFAGDGDSIAIEDGGNYELSNLPKNVRVKAKVKGDSGSVVFLVENTNTGEIKSYTDKERPYKFPTSARASLGTGTFKVDVNLFSKNDALCDQYWVMFTIVDTPKCGKIEGLTFTNGTDSIAIVNGETYEWNDLPTGFYLEMAVNGASQSARYYVKNADTDEVLTNTENSLPYNFPSTGNPWNLGIGSFKVDTALYANDDAHYPRCDKYWVMFSIINTPVACGNIEGVAITNGTESIAITEGMTYNIGDLPADFYLETLVNGASESVLYTIENLDIETVVIFGVNDIPYRYPGGDTAWDLGLGNFRVSTELFSENDCPAPACDRYSVTFTIADNPIECGAITNLLFTNGRTFFPIENNETYLQGELPLNFYINAEVNGVFESIEYAVTNNNTGRSQTVIQNDDPYTFPGGTAPWNLGLGTFSITAKLFLEDNAEGNNCNALTITFTIEEEEQCTANAGTLTANQSEICIVDEGRKLLRVLFDPIEISAEPNNDMQVPAGFLVIYLLTEGESLEVMDTSTSPVFEVTEKGNYRIHTLVYDPNTLDVETIEMGDITGAEINALLVQGGGDICGAFDNVGASIVIINPNAGTLLADASPVELERNGQATISATPQGDINIPDGFQSLYILALGTDLTIVLTALSPEFLVEEAGNYSIHTLVYDVNTLNVEEIELGITTLSDLSTLIAESEGELCASLDFDGTAISVIAGEDALLFLSKQLLSVNESVTNSIKLYANPLEATINISTQFNDHETLNYAILDLSGRHVSNGTVTPIGNDRASINIESLDNGLYLIAFTSSYRAVTKKVQVHK